MTVLDWQACCLCYRRFLSKLVKKEGGIEIELSIGEESREEGKKKTQSVRTHEMRLDSIGKRLDCDETSTEIQHLACREVNITDRQTDLPAMGMAMET